MATIDGSLRAVGNSRAVGQHRALKRPATELRRGSSQLVGSRLGSWALRCFNLRHVTRFEFVAKEARDHRCRKRGISAHSKNEFRESRTFGFTLFDRFDKSVSGFNHIIRRE